MRLFELRNTNGIELAIMPMGATIVSLRTPDRKGNCADIVLGFDTVEEYLEHSPYFGCVVGRFGNRINQGRLTICGTDYMLATNDGSNHLHGGNIGFDKKEWKVIHYDDNAIALQLISEDGDEGYPGKLICNLRYALDNNNRLSIDYQATADKTTVVNLTQHSYFNLAGHEAAAEKDSALKHTLKINADRYTEIDSKLIPTGALPSVSDTPFDFRTSTLVGERINAPHQQIKNADGYDHNYVLNDRVVSGKQEAAKLAHPDSGRTLTVYTNEPGMQFYSSNFLNGSFNGKQGVSYQRRGALVFETQHFPDSPNHADFPSTELKVGEEYKSRTVFEFGVE